MVEPRASKVAVVEEVRERLDRAAASIITEYRGLSVKKLAELRRNVAAAGADYKVFKNTLVRRAVLGSERQSLEPLLTGPTAIVFVRDDITAVARALRDFSRAYPALVIKGGLLGADVLSDGDLTALAQLPPRDVLLAGLAGTLAAPLAQLAGAMEALPRNLAYGLSGLVDQRRGEHGGGAGSPEALAGAREPEPAAEERGRPAAEVQAQESETDKPEQATRKEP